VTRFVGDQLQKDQAKLAGFEHSARAASTPAAAPALVAEIEMERAPASVPSAAAAHREQSLGDLDFDVTTRSAGIIFVSHRLVSF
jgi:hypothetical protein